MVVIMAFPSIDISVNDRQIPMLLDSGASAWPSIEAMEKGDEGGQVAAFHCRFNVR